MLHQVKPGHQDKSNPRHILLDTLWWHQRHHMWEDNMSHTVDTPFRLDTEVLNTK